MDTGSSPSSIEPIPLAPLPQSGPQAPIAPRVPPAIASQATGDGWSAAMMAVALLTLVGTIFLNSPARFDPRPWPAGSWLAPLVRLLGFYGALPTVMGIEIRDLLFGLGASVLAFLAGARLLAGAAPGRLWSGRLDVDALGRQPLGWWLLLLVADGLSSAFSHAPGVAWGGVVVHALWLAWWWALAANLTPAHARRLAGGLVAALVAVAALGVWYDAVRGAPGARLRYPFGNEGYLSAALLPGAIAALVLAIGGWRRPLHAVLALVGAGVTAYAIYLTGTRATLVGAAAALLSALACAAPRGRRLVVALLLIAAGGIAVRLALRTPIGQALRQRSYSVRSRWEHEWPIAVRLALQKPVLGHGAGGYAMLAGQMARDEQFDEPAVTAIMGPALGAWPSHAHNEPLELAAELGVVGLIAALGVILLTGRRAVAALDGLAPRDRLWARALLAALVGLSAEACFSVALRNPGLPPIFLTVLAALFALTRRPVEPASSSVEPGAPAWSASGLVACAFGLALGWLSIQDWRAARSRQAAQDALDHGRAAAAVAPADLAATFQLDPPRRLLAMLTAARSRAELFRAQLAAPAGANSVDTLALGQDALRVVERLKRAAPRYLLVSTLEADLCAGLAKTCERLNRPAEVRDYRARMVDALRQACLDEPFDVNLALQYLRVAPQTGTADALSLLAGVMRGGVVDDRWDLPFQALATRPDFRARSTTCAAWPNRTASARRRSGGTGSRRRCSASRPGPTCWAVTCGGRASRLQRAQAMYAAAEPRLVGAAAGALLELATCRLLESPTATGELMALVERVEAQRRRIDLAPDAADAVGRFRVAVSLAGGHESDARAWLAARSQAGAGVDRIVEPRLVGAYLWLVRTLLPTMPRADSANVTMWAVRARALAPRDLAACVALVRCHAVQGEYAAANEELAQIPKLTARPGEADAVVRSLRAAYPQLRPEGALKGGPAAMPPATRPGASP
ncbi:MAG: O-antigen ligase family protein [Phycisphaerae bacterium]